MLNAVGIDVSKGRSTVAVLQPGGVVVRKPFDVYHNQNEMNDLVSFINHWMVIQKLFLNVPAAIIGQSLKLCIEQISLCQLSIRI